MATYNILWQTCHSEYGFGSKAVTRNKAKANIPRIITPYIDEWFGQPHSQQLTRMPFCNRYVAYHTLQQSHAGIAHFRQAIVDIGFKSALIAFDIGARGVVGYPMKVKLD